MVVALWQKGARPLGEPVSRAYIDRRKMRADKKGAGLGRAWRDKAVNRCDRRKPLEAERRSREA